MKAGMKVNRVSRLVHLGWIVLVVASCASPTPVQVDDSATTTVQREAQSETIASDGERTDQDTAAEPQTPVVERAKPLLLVTNPTATGITLFADELAPLRVALADALAKSHDVVPLKTVTQEVRNARNNTLPNGKQCARTPHPILISHAIHEGSSLTESQVMCSELGCELRVQSQDNRVRMHTKLSLPTANDSPETIVARWVEELAERPLEQTRRLDVPLTKPVVATVKRSQKSRVVGFVDPSASLTDLGKPLQAALKAVERCTSRYPTINPEDRYMVSFNTSGKVDRCESERLDQHSSPGFDCVCEALHKNLRVPKAKKGESARRAALSLFVDSGREHPRVSLKFQSSDDKVAHLATDVVANEELARCMAPLGSDFEVGVIMEVAGQGEHVAHSTSWTTVGKREVPDSVKACLKPILRAAQMTCPWNERATVRGKVFVSFDPPVE